MRLQCDKCQIWYDDATKWMDCPHELIRTPIADVIRTGIKEIQKKESPYCGSCKFYVETVSGDGKVDSVGDCHRMPPISLPLIQDGTTNQEDGYATVWPEVFEFEWCGEYQEK